MYEFKAYRWDGKTYIGGECYNNCELLTSYLNLDVTELEERYKNIPFYKNDLLFAPNYKDYKVQLSNIQDFMTYVDKLTLSLPLYNKLLKKIKPRSNELMKLFEEYRWLYEDADYNYKKDKFEYWNDDKDNEGYNNPKDSYKPMLEDYSENESDKEYTDKFIILLNDYCTFVNDILRVKEVYSKFLDEYIFTGTSFLDAYKIAEVAKKFKADLETKHKGIDKSSIYNGYRILEPSYNVTITYESMDFKKGSNKNTLLCETIIYNSLGAYLYHELFNGLLSGVVSKRCGNCGNYFLLNTGYYAEFCDNIAPGEEDKTCKDIGARRKFDQKVKSDPVWTVYQRAYKTHYARVIKKKMSKADFAAWVDMAIKLREQAIKRKIEFEEYERKIRE
jgi:hypothetical protein